MKGATTHACLNILWPYPPLVLMKTGLFQTHATDEFSKSDDILTQCPSLTASLRVYQFHVNDRLKFLLKPFDFSFISE